jgi:hypothetical protein
MFESIIVPPGWLCFENQLINTEFLYLIKPSEPNPSRKPGVSLHYMTGKVITVPISMEQMSFLLNEAQVSALLDTPEKSMMLKIKSENTILKGKLAKLEKSEE